MNKELIKQCCRWDDTQIRGFFDIGGAGYRHLSNFHLCEVMYDGVIYPSSENAYMAAKTLDLKERRALESLTPAEAKKIGRSLTLRNDWESVKLGVMHSVLLDKFTRNPELRKKLAMTGWRYLEETNWWGDKFWGADFRTGEGENNLGKTLMEIRAKIS